MFLGKRRVFQDDKKKILGTGTGSKKNSMALMNRDWNQKGISWLC
jgi:hypothetical protein